MADEIDVLTGIPKGMIATLESGLDNLHHLTWRFAGQTLALVFLSTDETAVQEVAFLGAISIARVDGDTLYIEVVSLTARSLYGTIHHELGKKRAWTGAGHQCVLIIANEPDVEEMIGPLRRYTKNIGDLRR